MDAKKGRKRPRFINLHMGDRKGLMTIDDVTSAVMIVNVIRDKCKSYFNHPASKNPDPDPANN